MPISCHFQDGKALLVTILTHVSSAISRTGLYFFRWEYLQTVSFHVQLWYQKLCIFKLNSYMMTNEILAHTSIVLISTGWYFQVRIVHKNKLFIMGTAVRFTSEKIKGIQTRNSVDDRLIIFGILSGCLCWRWSLWSYWSPRSIIWELDVIWIEHFIQYFSEQAAHECKQ